MLMVGKDMQYKLKLSVIIILLQRFVFIFQGEKEAPVAYTVFTVFLIVGMTIYYCVAVNYFL